MTGFVRLDAALADDLGVVNAARVSLGKRSDSMGDSDAALIGFLMRNRHGSPFEHNMFRFHVRCPIFVAREWFRHRIGSFNELSGRYTTLDEDAWVPSLDAVRTQVGKPGAYTYTPMALADGVEVRDVIEAQNRHAFGTYRWLLENGVAREVARTVLPVGTFTEFYWTVNARSLMNFLSLRTAPEAQREIREYAIEVEAFFAEQMPVTHAAWVEQGKETP